MSATKRLWSLDVFRGLCAFAVFFTHWTSWCDFAPVSRLDRFLHGFLSNIFDLFSMLTWRTGGIHPAVIGFFVLSGFCIHAKQAGSRRIGSTIFEWKTYFKNRAHRILPVYWWASLLGILFVLLQRGFPAPNPLLSFHATGTLVDFGLRLAGLYALVPHEILVGNYTLNTVATEIVLYALYPAFLFFALRGAWPAMAVACVLAQFAVRLFLPHIPIEWVYGTLPMMAAFWYAGALSAHWYFSKPRRVAGLSLIVTWGIFLAARELPSFYGRNLLLQLLWCTVCAVGLLWLAELERQHAGLAKHPTVRALRGLGLVSYSLYAMHTPAVMLATWSMLSFATDRLSYSLQLTATLAATIMATSASYYFIERRYFISRKRDTAVHTVLPNTAAGISA